MLSSATFEELFSVVSTLSFALVVVREVFVVVVVGDVVDSTVVLDVEVVVVEFDADDFDVGKGGAFAFSRLPAIEHCKSITDFNH